MSVKKSKVPVHIVEDGYCYACQGECKYINNEKMRIADNITVIMGDLPNDLELGFSNVPMDALIKLASMEEGAEYGEQEKD